MLYISACVRFVALVPLLLMLLLYYCCCCWPDVCAAACETSKI